MDVSENSGTPKSSILIRFSIIFTIHFGVPLFFGNTQIGDPTKKNTLAFAPPLRRNLLQQWPGRPVAQLGLLLLLLVVVVVVVGVGVLDEDIWLDLDFQEFGTI